MHAALSWRRQTLHLVDTTHGKALSKISSFLQHCCHVLTCFGWFRTNRTPRKTCSSHSTSHTSTSTANSRHLTIHLSTWSLWGTHTHTHSLDGQYLYIPNYFILVIPQQHITLLSIYSCIYCFGLSLKWVTCAVMALIFTRLSNHLQRNCKAPCPENMSENKVTLICLTCTLY